MIEHLVEPQTRCSARDCPLPAHLNGRCVRHSRLAAEGLRQQAIERLAREGIEIDAWGAAHCLPLTSQGEQHDDPPDDFPLSD